MMLLRPWQLLSIALAGWINRRQQQVIAYQKGGGGVMGFGTVRGLAMCGDGIPQAGVHDGDAMLILR